MRQALHKFTMSGTAARRRRFAWLAGLAVAAAALASPAAAAPPHAALAAAGPGQAAGHAPAVDGAARVMPVDGWRGGPGPRGWGPRGGYYRPYYGRGGAYGRGWYGGGWYGPGWGGWYGAPPIIVAPRVVVVQPWSPAWYRSCRVRYRSFDPRTGYYVVGGGRRVFCR